MIVYKLFVFFFFQAEDGIRDTDRSRGLGDVYKRQDYWGIEVHESFVTVEKIRNAFLGITAKQRTLLELFKKHNEDARKLVGISKTPATLAKYGRCRP